jgi:hypothetical protein
MAKVNVSNDDKAASTKNLSVDVDITQYEGLEWIHVAQDTVLRYILCEHSNKSVSSTE